MGDDDRLKEMKIVPDVARQAPVRAVNGRPGDRLGNGGCRVRWGVNPCRRTGGKRMVVVTKEVFVAVSSDDFHLSRQGVFRFPIQGFQFLKIGFSSWKGRSYVSDRCIPQSRSAAQKPGSGRCSTISSPRQGSRSGGR